MQSIRTITCKVLATDEQAAHIEETLKAFAHASNAVAEWGRVHKVSQQFRLQKACYKQVRAQFGLSANLTCQVIVRAASVLANRHVRHQTFKPTSLSLDARIFRLDREAEIASVRLLTGREKLRLKMGQFQREALVDHNPKSAMLCKTRKGYSLNVQIKEDVPAPPDEVEGTLGVDLGITNIATLSDGTQYAGTELNAYRQHRGTIRASLQSKAERIRSARKGCRRVLKRLSGKEHRFQMWVNHQIANAIVAKAKHLGWAIAMEALEGIRRRTGLGKAHRKRLGSWAFCQLRTFVEYKARRAGVLILAVNPAYTSKMCSECLHMGVRSGELFRCDNCGHKDHADVNAAVNTATVGAAVSQPGYPPLSCLLDPKAAACTAG